MTNQSEGKVKGVTMPIGRVLDITENQARGDRAREAARVEKMMEDIGSIIGMPAAVFTGDELPERFKTAYVSGTAEGNALMMSDVQRIGVHAGNHYVMEGSKKQRVTEVTPRMQVLGMNTEAFRAQLAQHLTDAVFQTNGEDITSFMVPVIMRQKDEVFITTVKVLPPRSPECTEGEYQVHILRTDGGADVFKVRELTLDAPMTLENGSGRVQVTVPGDPDNMVF